MTDAPSREEGGSGLTAMDPESRRRFCREVLEHLSDLVEGEAPEDFCLRVDELLGDCQPYLAFRNTFVATIRLTESLGQGAPRGGGLDEEAYRRCVDRVREAVDRERSE